MYERSQRAARALEELEEASAAGRSLARLLLELRDDLNTLTLAIYDRRAHELIPSQLHTGEARELLRALQSLKKA